MEKNRDYSGPFDPNWSHEGLTGDTLLRLVKAYGEYLHRMDGSWYMAVKSRSGNDEAFACDRRVWEEGLLDYELRLISEVLNIRGKDVAAVMKYFQANPMGAANKPVVDLKSNNLAILTFPDCRSLAVMEREKNGREKLVCQDLTTVLFSRTADYFNPKIKVTPLKVPPRTTYSDCSCQWEFRLD